MKKIIGLSFILIVGSAGVLVAQSKGATNYELTASRIGPAGLSSGGNFTEQGILTSQSGATISGGQFSEDSVVNVFSITPFPSAWLVY